MKKEYVSPEMEIIRYSLKDVLSASPTEAQYSDIYSEGDLDPTEIGWEI